MNATMARKKLLLLGAGPTSSLIAYNLQKSSKLKDVFDVHVWEKSRGIGGRFSTSRNPNNPISSYADLGAQYLTCSSELQFSKPYFKDLLEHKLIREIETTQNIPGFRHDATKTNYFCTRGTGSIVKYFFNEANNVTFTFNKRVTGINSTHTNGESTTSSSIIVYTEEEGKNENFDFVITTIPVPQILELKNIDGILGAGLKSDLEKVKYTSRFALGLFYDNKEGPFPNFENVKPINFLNDDSIIRYWSVENKKRGPPEKEPCAIVVHTSVSFGAENVDKTPDSMKDFLLEKVTKNLFPTSNTISPAFVKSHKWKYSQVETPFVGTPGFVELSKNIILAGDGFVQSGIEGCIESSQKTVELLEKLLH